MSDLYSLNYLVGADLSRNSFSVLKNSFSNSDAKYKENDVPDKEKGEILGSNRVIMFEDMNRLTWLKLNSCHLQQIPPEMKKCDQLQRLSAKYNKLKSLPDPEAVPAIESLNFRNNLLSQSTAVMYFEELKELNFSHNEFRQFPMDLSNQKKLRVLSVAHNKIKEVPNEFFNEMAEMRYLDFSGNDISTISSAVRRLEGKLFHLSIAKNPNLENDKLRSVFAGLRNLQSLNLSYTKRTEASLTDLGNLKKLKNLDLCGNEIKSIPSSLYELHELKHLRLNNNNLTSFSVKEGSLKNLESLNLSSNQIIELEESIGSLNKLTRLFLNNNKLTTLPDSFKNLTELKVLWVNRNEIGIFPKQITKCTKLEKLYLSFNKIKKIPIDIYLLFELEQFTTLGNPGIVIPRRPKKIDEVAQFYYVSFMSAKDEMERIGEQEDEIIEEDRDEVIVHIKSEVFVRATEDHLPEKGIKAEGLLYFKTGDIIRNVKPSNTQFWEGTINSRTGYFPARKVVEIQPKESIAFKETQKNQNNNEKQKTDDTLLNGLRHQAEGKTMGSSEENLNDNFDLDFEVNLQPKKAQGKGMVMKDIYSPDVGKKLGVDCWAIDDFKPISAQENLSSGLYSGDAYIILHTHYGRDMNGNVDREKLDWTIYYWIGHSSSTDKRACVAIHAVNLKAHMQGGNIKRLLEGDETEEFLKLVSAPVLDGSKYESALKAVEEVQTSMHCYMLLSTGRNIQACLVDEYEPTFSAESILLFDQGPIKHVWYGKNTLSTHRNKARLFVSKINKNDYQGRANVVEVEQNDEPESFWDAIDMDPPEIPTSVPQELMPVPGYTVFYTVELNLPPSWEIAKHPGTGRRYFLHKKGNNEIKKYDTLPLMNAREFQGGFFQVYQTEIRDNKMSRDMLQDDKVHIIDANSMINVWSGSKTEKLSRALASDLKDILANVFNRPEFSRSREVRQFAEPYIFKTLFYDWTESSANVDFSGATGKPKEQKGSLSSVEIQAITKRKKKLWPAPLPPKCSLDYEVQALFAYKHWENNEYYDNLRADCNFECSHPDKFELVFRLQNKKFVPVFDKMEPVYETESRIYLVDYRIVDVGCEKEQIERVAYVWHGRKAPLMDWLNFSHGLKELFCDLFLTQLDFDNKKEKLDMQRTLRRYVKSIQQYCDGYTEDDLFFLLAKTIFINDDFNEYKLVRIYQQREPERFMCHFKYRLTVFRGAVDASNQIRLLKYGQQSNIINTRTVEVERTCKNLNSNYVYFLLVPYKEENQDEDQYGVCYIWFGKYVTDKVCQDAYDQCLWVFPRGYKIRVAPEGHEHPDFFEAMGDKKDYETDQYDHFCRMFRCSNSKGYFNVTELSTDFAQDDLSNKDAFIMDTQLHLFLWIGKSTSDVVAKLCLQAAKAYLRDKRRSTLELKLIMPGKEPHQFTRYFFTWDRNKEF